MPTVTISRTDFEMQVIPDESPDPSYLDQEGFEDRKAEYERGDFRFIGIRAVATVRIPYGSDHIESTIESPGLWGIESDSDEDYLRSVFDEESQVLAKMLDGLNIQVVA